MYSFHTSNVCNNKILLQDKTLENFFSVIYVKIRIAASQNFSIQKS